MNNKIIIATYESYLKLMNCLVLGVFHLTFLGSSCPKLRRGTLGISVGTAVCCHEVYRHSVICGPHRSPVR